MFSDSGSGSSYYYVGVEDNGRLLAYSDGYAIIAPFGDRVIQMDVDYSQIKYSAYYNFCVYACGYSSDVGNLNLATKKGGPVSLSVNTTSWDTTSCYQICCTRPSDPSARYYAQAQKLFPDIIAVKASIKTRYGTLCNAPAGTDNAFCVVYASVFSNGVYRWAQTGYGYERNPDWGNRVYYYRYAEVRGYNGIRPKYDSISPPSETSAHVYECKLNLATGTWQFYDDGVCWYTYSDGAWINSPGDGIGWTGEICNFEDDLAGTVGNKCTVTSCGYKENGDANYRNPNIASSDIYSDDINEWGIEVVSGTAVNIWDKNPR